MLKTVERSSAKKTAGIAVTYRAGKEDKFDTCPADCKLNSSGRGCSSQEIDHEYLDTVLNSKPRRGFSFGYSHFDPLYWAFKLAPNKTTINYSADSLRSAYCTVANKIAPAVVVVKNSFWKNKKYVSINFDDMPTGKIRVVRCPNEYLDLTCENCGGKDGPLCARLNRDYIIGFTGHGASKGKIENDEIGGCYAGGGNVALHWEDTSKQEQTKTDAEILWEFFCKLSPRAIIRHHIAGDFGKDG